MPWGRKKNTKPTYHYRVLNMGAFFLSRFGTEDFACGQTVWPSGVNQFILCAVHNFTKKSSKRLQW